MSEKKLQIIIEVRGGVVQEVHSNTPDSPDSVEYYILDYDNIEAGEKCEIPQEVLAACGVELD